MFTELEQSMLEYMLSSEKHNVETSLAKADLPAFVRVGRNYRLRVIESALAKVRANGQGAPGIEHISFANEIIEAMDLI